SNPLLRIRSQDRNNRTPPSRSLRVLQLTILSERRRARNRLPSRTLRGRWVVFITPRLSRINHPGLTCEVDELDVFLSQPSIGVLFAEVCNSCCHVDVIQRAFKVLSCH